MGIESRSPCIVNSLARLSVLLSFLQTEDCNRPRVFVRLSFTTALPTKQWRKTTEQMTNSTSECRGAVLHVLFKLLIGHTVYDSNQYCSSITPPVLARDSQLKNIVTLLQSAHVQHRAVDTLYGTTEKRCLGDMEMITCIGVTIGEVLYCTCTVVFNRPVMNGQSMLP